MAEEMFDPGLLVGFSIRAIPMIDAQGVAHAVRAWGVKETLYADCSEQEWRGLARRAESEVSCMACLAAGRPLT